MSNIKKGPSVKMIIVYISMITFILYVLSGCRSIKEKSLAYAMEHPKDFAKFCGDYYPPKDSVGKPQIVYVPADNKNYKDEINKLYDKVDSLRLVIHQDKTDCGVIYQPVIDELKGQVKSLKDKYKPCVPDTAYIETKIYQTNTGLVTSLTNKLEAMTNDYLKASEASTKKNYWIGGLAFLLVAALFILIRRK